MKWSGSWKPISSMILRRGSSSSRPTSVGALEEAATNAVAEKRRELGAPSLIKDAPWTCPDCGKTSEPVLILGRTMGLPPSCPCIDAARDRAREAYRATYWAAMVDSEWSQIRIPRRHRNATFDDFEPRDGTKDALAQCRAYVDGYTPYRTTDGLVLMGPWGAGKTHLAIATARAIHARTLAAVHGITAADLIDGSRNFQRAAIETAISAEITILDDVGQGHMTDWARGVVYEVIDARYQSARPTLVTTNLDVDGLRDRLGGAAVSRLLESAEWIEVIAKDYRAELARRRRAA